VEKQIGSEAVRKLNQLRTNFEPAPVPNQFFFWWKRGKRVALCSSSSSLTIPYHNPFFYGGINDFLSSVEAQGLMMPFSSIQ